MRCAGACRGMSIILDIHLPLKLLCVLCCASLTESCLVLTLTLLPLLSHNTAHTSSTTGSGKTTLLSQLGLDFAQQAKPVLWGSFEQRNSNRQLMAKMVQQSHKPRRLSELTESALNKVANDFEKLPIKFLNFQETMGIEQVSRDVCLVH